MESSFFRKVLITMMFAAALAGIIQAARHMGSSVESSMDADTLKARTPVPTPRRY